MNQEDIQKLIEMGFLVPKYFKEDKYILVQTTDITEMLEICVKLRIDGKMPVVVFQENNIFLRRYALKKNVQNTKRIMHLTRHCYFIDPPVRTYLEKEFFIPNMIGKEHKFIFFRKGGFKLVEVKKEKGFPPHPHSQKENLVVDNE